MAILVFELVHKVFGEALKAVNAQQKHVKVLNSR